MTDDRTEEIRQRWTRGLTVHEALPYVTADIAYLLGEVDRLRAWNLAGNGTVAEANKTIECLRAVVDELRSQSPVTATDLIEHHRNIWREHHAVIGMTLAESATGWLELLDRDPYMTDLMNWPDLAGRVSGTDRAVFRDWLEMTASRSPRTDALDGTP